MFILDKMHDKCEMCSKYIPELKSVVLDVDSQKYDYTIGCAYTNYPRCFSNKKVLYREIRTYE